MNKGFLLLVGLGNPGQEYQNTRHNAGAWLVERLAEQHQQALSKSSKYPGLVARISLQGHNLHLLIPQTFMNLSGQAVAPLANFYKILPEQIIVAHDELDLEPGVVRLKQGGGHGGHNGLRDIISRLGNNKNFARLRLGIGHPGNAKQVTGYVLGKAPNQEQQRIDEAIAESLRLLPGIVSGEGEKAMNQLHRFKAE